MRASQATDKGLAQKSKSTHNEDDTPSEAQPYRGGALDAMVGDIVVDIDGLFPFPPGLSPQSTAKSTDSTSTVCSYSAEWSRLVPENQVHVSSFGPNVLSCRTQVPPRPHGFHRSKLVESGTDRQARRWLQKFCSYSS